MAKRNLSSLDDRDHSQRALGWMGVSAFVHVGLLLAVLIAPSFRTPRGDLKGTDAGLEFTGEQIAEAAPMKSQSAEAQTSGEVLLADASDTNAVALPSAPAPDAPKTEAPKVQAATEKPLPKKQIHAKPKSESSDIVSALKAARTEATQEKPEKSEPTPAAMDVATTEESDVEVATAEEPATPVQIALPEKEALTDEQAEALQAPPEKTEALADEPTTPVAAAAVIQQPATPPAAQAPTPSKLQPAPQPLAAPPAQTAAPATGLIVSNGHLVARNSTGGSNMVGAINGTGTAPTAPASGGGNAGVGTPYGIQVRDARSLQAMPGNPLASYPLPDRLAGREGTTVLLGKVRNDGRVENVVLEKSSGSRLMDQSAAQAFSQWKYKPGQEGYVRLPMQFKLVGNARIIPAQLNRQ